MDLEIKIDKACVYITVIGAIDTEGGSELTSKFVEVVKDTSIKDAIFNLRDVPSVTSAGIGKLLTFYKHFDKLGGSMKIQGVSDALRKQFSEIHLDQIISVT